MLPNNQLPTKFLFISDPGHGWLVTEPEAVNAVGLSIFEFSQYSFLWEGMLFLEEDADATLFALAYEATTGRVIETVTKEVAHFDRNKTRLPGWGDDGEAHAQKCKALRLLIQSRKLAEGEAA